MPQEIRRSTAKVGVLNVLKRIHRQTVQASMPNRIHRLPVRAGMP
jgi:hypothetical protein